MQKKDDRRIGTISVDPLIFDAQGISAAIEVGELHVIVHGVSGLSIRSRLAETT
jgi:hypothetical protein